LPEREDRSGRDVGDATLVRAGAVALFAFGLEFVEVVDFAEGTEKILTEVGVNAGFLGSDAAADAVEENGFEEGVDLIGGGEGAGSFGEFGGSELFGCGFVGAAEAGIVGASGLGALASGGGAMLAAGKSEFGFRFKKIEIHFGTP
jgi:hypothetical protein